MANRLLLTENQIKQLKILPEDGMGYQIVNIEMNDGRLLNERIVLNSSYLKLNENEYIDPEKILRISINVNSKINQIPIQNMKKQRFYFNAQGNDDEAYRQAIQFACSFTKEDDEIKKVTLLIHRRNETGLFKNLFENDTIKQLFKGLTFNNCKPIFKFETTKTLNDDLATSQLVISCGLDAHNVFKLDNFNSVKVIIAIPWRIDLLIKWIKTWNPTELLGNQEAIQPYLEPSCIVRKALSDLNTSIVSKDIKHPLDKEKAKTYILALHNFESSLDPDVIGSYLIRDLEWKAKNANDIEKLIITLNNGKHFKGGERTKLKEYYNRWKKACS